MNDIQLLSSVPIFSELESSVLKELHSRMDKRSYQENNMILMEEEFGNTLFIICRGSVKITRIREDDREVIFAMLGEGEFFGELSLLDGKTRSANAVALEHTDVLVLKRHDFIASLEEHPKIAIGLLTELARRIRKSDELIESLSLSDAQHRVGMTLLRVAAELGTIRKGVVEIRNLPYRNDIARMAGVSRETVSRTLKLFETERLIQYRGRKVSILDYTYFKRMFG